MLESTTSPQSGTKNLATVLIYLEVNALSPEVNEDPVLLAKEVHHLLFLLVHLPLSSHACSVFNSLFVAPETPENLLVT
jgi:hypothetical protein